MKLIDGNADVIVNYRIYCMYHDVSVYSSNQTFIPQYHHDVYIVALHLEAMVHITCMSNIIAYNTVEQNGITGAIFLRVSGAQNVEKIWT